VWFFLLQKFRTQFIFSLSFFFLDIEKESPIFNAICQFDATATPVKIHGNALGS
jgi:hypothetical protein